MNLTIAIRTLYAVTLLAGAVHRTLIAYDHYLRIDARRQARQEPRPKPDTALDPHENDW